MLFLLAFRWSSSVSMTSGVAIMRTSCNSRRTLPLRNRSRLHGHTFRRSGFVRRADVREHGKQVFVRPYVISCHLSICDDREEDIYRVVRKFPAIFRV